MSGGFLLSTFVLSVLFSGCAPHKRLNPDYCEPGAGIDCVSPRVCDVPRYRCVTPDAATESGEDRGRTDAGDATDAPIGTDGGADAGLDGVDGVDGVDSVDVPPCPTCAGETPLCDPLVGICAPCATHEQCASLARGTPFCQMGGGACVVCNSDDDCPTALGKRWCLERRECAGCRTNADCPSAAPVCDATHTCTACKSAADCSARTDHPACDLMVGACVECTEHTDCKAITKPACGANRTCTACRSDDQCVRKQGSPNPGVCMFHADGHCATDAETLYVKPAAGCDDGATATGTAAKPFCTTQRALSAVTPQKPLIVIRPGGGTIALERWTYTAVAGVNELTVIGQEGATIGPGAGIGITINSGNVYLRGLGVSGMLDAGIHVPTGNTTLRMNRCVVTGNTGGLFINGAGFEINNCVFANNARATIPNPNGPPIEYGGAYLGGVLTRPTVFRNNTVYANDGPGLVCGGAYSVKGVLVAGNATAEVVMCAVVDGTSEVALAGTPYQPRFDPVRPFRLTLASPCVDKGTSTNDAPPDDIDGNPRPSPAGGITDCGAHELQK